MEDAESATYTPVDGDNGYYLRATVTYTDPEGSDKPAMERSEFQSQGVRGDNSAPEFPDQDPVMDGDQSNTATREIAENTEAGEPVGAPVTAEDDDGDTLTYALWDADGGQDGDSASFDIDWGTGQIMTKEDLNEETKGEYMVVVRATDPEGIPGASSADDTNSDEITVTITITDVNEAPEFTATSAGGAHTVAENSNITADNRYAADDPDESDTADPTWTLSGPDRSKFDITGGVLTFKAASVPNFEMPADANGDNVYEVTVVATVAGKAGMRAVKVTVENAEEAGMVTLNKVQPRVGIPVTASLTDPDGSVSRLTWQWTDGTNGIEGATSDTYTPTAEDLTGNVTLVAEASYTDGHGPTKTAEGTAANAVEADTRNKAPAFGDEDLETDGVQNDMAARKVEENTEADAADDSTADDTDGDPPSDNVGMPVTATDPDPNADPLTYTLSGADAGSFRVRDNGQIEVGAGTELDYEMKQTYMVTVIAEDSFGATASIPVTIMVTPVDEMPVITVGASTNRAPMFPSSTATRSIVEGTAAGENIGLPVTATDADNDTLTYTLNGADMADFDIDAATGQLMTKSALDHETRTLYTVAVTRIGWEWRHRHRDRRDRGHRRR